MGGFLRVSRGVRVGATDGMRHAGGSTTQHAASEDATEQAVLRSAVRYAERSVADPPASWRPMIVSAEAITS